MLVFTQDLSDHSRLGNSLSWMSRVEPLIKRFDFHYPWAHEQLSDYLSRDSIWIKKFHEKSLRLQSIINFEPTNKNLYFYTRKIEENFGYKGWLGRWNNESIKIINEENNFIYISGCVRFDELYNSLCADFDSKIIFVHEPISLNLQENPAAYEQLLPDIELINRSKNYINTVSADANIVAVHIRRGDYSRWQNGAFYFSDEYWCDLVVDILDRGEIPLVFSNDLSSSLANELKRLGAFISNQGANDDFVRLMFVNKIIGPPSTYTKLAAEIAYSLLDRKIEVNFLNPINE